MTSSRPTSAALYSAGPIYHVNPPSLSQILTNTSHPPWTLAAFMAYLSQNHCLETLEFTMDADRYRNAYCQIITEQASPIADGNEHICSLWDKLMQAYIIPELDEAVTIVYELMNDSVLLPFIESLSPAHSETHMEEDYTDASRQGRSRLQLYHHEAMPASGANSRSASRSADLADREGLSDDNHSAASPSTEPMTPPTTPPTSEWTFNTSPGGFQRALTAHNNGWKKMGAKLGFNRKSRTTSRRINPTSSGPVDSDQAMSDVSRHDSL
ncbi:hypothetical protein HYQ45_016203 [Verticillium longisporum]|uniref:RGS domain-containing protein n=1 Tax=Verticillium longisporum TaxID=100787 RepID=A0A8I2Z6C8_VERLO|nr:hypothetical protein HYQ45_016203 [Verticillium longisporum]